MLRNSAIKQPMSVKTELLDRLDTYIGVFTVTLITLLLKYSRLEINNYIQIPK